MNATSDYLNEPAREYHKVIKDYADWAAGEWCEANNTDFETFAHVIHADPGYTIDIVRQVYGVNFAACDDVVLYLLDEANRILNG